MNPGGVWYKLPPSIRRKNIEAGWRLLRDGGGCDGWAERGREGVFFLAGLAEGVKGWNADADSMIDHRARDLARRSVCGMQGAAKRWGTQPAKGKAAKGASVAEDAETDWRPLSVENVKALQNEFSQLFKLHGEAVALEKFGRHFHAFMVAVDSGQKGNGCIADAVISDHDRMRGQRRANGSKGAAARWQKNTDAAPSPDAGAIAKPCKKDGFANALAMTDERTKNEEERKQPRKPKAKAGESEGAAGAGVSGVSGMNETRFRKRGAEGADKVAADAVGKAIAEQGAKDAAWCIPDSLLPMLAAVYCRDAERSRAVGAYGKQMRRLGAVAFRDAVGRFVHECEAGEMDGVRSRGALLLSRLKDAPGAEG